MTYNTSADAARHDETFLAMRNALSGDQQHSVNDCRAALAQATTSLNERFKRGESVMDLVRLRSAVIDQLLTHLWLQYAGGLADDAALVAVGGYGRGELHPYSDVDIMILVADVLPHAAETKVSEFVAALWDIGLEIGHSVRNVAQCREQSKEDITVVTTLTEARLISGPVTLFSEMQAAVSADEIWPSDQFFAAKRNEQRARHHRYDDTAYKLEPNVKGSPGGLRDIQMIGWVAKRHFAVKTLDELVAHKFLTPGQLRVLNDGQEFLWRVRFGLHVLTGRREDRLLFDHQSRLAEMLGYEDATYTLAVEQMMQRYYRTVMELSRINEMLLQLFEEAILMDPDAEPQAINERFQIKNGFLQTTNDNVFEIEPTALLELFLLLQQHAEIRGVSALTIGLIKRNLHLIDENFRQNPRNHELFLSILRAPAGVTHELRRMNLYGVLGLYIPSFGRIVGRMQYDLFHAYTVDQHTLFVVNNLRRFALTRFDHEYPHCSPLMQSFEKPEIAYLAGLFHDIAKGRGGDHSELGAVDAEAFCLENGLSQYEARTVAWLVRNHLVLSMTAQKKDLSDPDVINEFAAMVRDQMHLDYLYVLTVADVRGTNPNLWNSWKATLFRDLYELTTHALRRGLEKPIDRELLISETQTAARELLQKTNTPAATVDHIWESFTDDYFLRYRSEEIAWHTNILGSAKSDLSDGLLDVRQQADGDGVEAMLYVPRSTRTFANAAAFIAELGMTIVDVRIVPITNDYSLDTYIFMELDRRTVVDAERLKKISRTLTQILTATDASPARVTRPAPRQVRLFRTKTLVHFEQDFTKSRTVMELIAGDRPGLLSIVGQTLIEFAIHIETAKILTIGERAEDVFYVVDKDGNTLDEETCNNLRERLIERIDSNL
ncbi:MAG: [protein-PII] uridylyltransferase [Gammaproteobacteria bacterium]|nr:MAG: [protein-PII] uridylyltransferase [Gammaproteobacteria bacterium]